MLVPGCIVCGVSAYPATGQDRLARLACGQRALRYAAFGDIAHARTRFAPSAAVPGAASAAAEPRGCLAPVLVPPRPARRPAIAPALVDAAPVVPAIAVAPAAAAAVGIAATAGVVVSVVAVGVAPGAVPPAPARAAVAPVAVTTVRATVVTAVSPPTATARRPFTVTAAVNATVAVAAAPPAASPAVFVAVTAPAPARPCRPPVLAAHGARLCPSCCIAWPAGGCGRCSSVGSRGSGRGGCRRARDARGLVLGSLHGPQTFFALAVELLAELPGRHLVVAAFGQRSVPLAELVERRPLLPQGLLQDAHPLRCVLSRVRNHATARARRHWPVMVAGEVVIVLLVHFRACFGLSPTRSWPDQAGEPLALSRPGPSRSGPSSPFPRIIRGVLFVVAFRARLSSSAASPHARRRLAHTPLPLPAAGMAARGHAADESKSAARRGRAAAAVPPALPPPDGEA